MYKVVSDFRDAKNDNHLYRVGDEYPVAGYKPSKARIEELAKGKNKFGKERQSPRQLLCRKTHSHRTDESAFLPLRQICLRQTPSDYHVSQHTHQ